MKTSGQVINRREFLTRGLPGVGILAATGATLALSMRSAQAAAGKEISRFTYDLERVSKTDPKLVQYEEVGRFACGDPEPRRLAIGPEDRLYVAHGKGVSVFDGSGARQRDLPTAAAARCVAVANDGTVYIGHRDHVEVYDRKGARMAGWASPGPRAWFTGLAVSENEVFAADAGNRVILRYDRSGKVAGRIGEKDKERNVPGLIVPSPYLDVALARDGLLRVNNPGRHRVETYTTAGDLELAWGKPSAAIEGFCGCCNPVAVAVLPDGRCITCEKGLPRAKVYAADGTFECVVAGTESFPENARAGAANDKSDGVLGGLDVAVDSQGRVYVLDVVAGNVRVMRRKA